MGPERTTDRLSVSGGSRFRAVHGSAPADPVAARGPGRRRGIPCFDAGPAEREEVMEVVDVPSVRPDGPPGGDYGPRR